MRRVSGHEFRQAKEPTCWAEHYLHELILGEESEPFPKEDEGAAYEVARSSWAIVRMLCTEAGIELPREPDWETFLKQYVDR